jgi:hypothetical protein
MDELMMRDFVSSLLCSVKADEGTAGGGGAGGDKGKAGAAGGAGAGAGAGDDDDDGDDDLDERIKKVVARQVSGAVDGRLGRGKMKEIIAESVRGVLGEVLPEALKPLGLSKAPAAGADDGEDTPKMKQLRAEQQALAAKLEEQKRERETERSARLEAENRSLLQAALRAAGVPDNRLRGATAELYLDQKRVKRDADDRVVMTFKRDGYVEDLELSEGVAEWLKTEDGKVYLPPVETRGSGNQGGKAGKGQQRDKNGRMPKSQALQVLGEAMATGAWRPR